VERCDGARRGESRQGRNGWAWKGLARSGGARFGRNGGEGAACRGLAGNKNKGEKVKKAKKASIETPEDVIHDAIRALDRDGRLTPEAVVRAAKNPKSPLHDRFEWDDSVAAHKHRLEQARCLIRSVMVTITTETKTISTVHYVRDPSAEPEQGYVSIAQLRSEPENARVMLLRAFDQAKTYLSRAEDFADVLGQREAVESVSRKLQRVVSRFEAESGATASL